MENNNVLSYITWRGDIDLNARPFSAVDALVLSCFVYIDFKGIVPSSNKTITVKKAAEEYFSSDSPHDKNGIRYQSLLKLMAGSVRFANAKLSNFVFILTDKTQFCAMRVTLDDGTNFLAFRGTDDSLVGWKEDFEISFKTTPAQEAAATYLKEMLKDNNEVFVLGGHSKGGNLAEYALFSLSQKQRERISAVYTFDSPGLSKRVDEIQPKIHRFVPEFSIIGRLFEPEEGLKATIVVSDRPKLAQHDPMSWEIEGSQFVTRKHRNPESRIYNQMINQWIEEASPAEREALTNDLFDSFAASGATKITELNKNGFGGFGAILLSLTDSSRRTRFVLGSLWRAILQRFKSLHLERLFMTRASLIGWAMIILGLIDLRAPNYTYRAFGALAAVFTLFWSADHIITAANSKLKPRSKRFFIISYLVTFALSVGILSNNSWLTFLAHYALGVFLIGFAYVKLRAVILRKIDGVLRIVLDVIEGLLAFAVGVTVIVRPRTFSKESLIFLGIFLIVYGFFKLIMELFRQRSMPKDHR